MKASMEISSQYLKDDLYLYEKPASVAGWTSIALGKRSRDGGYIRFVKKRVSFVSAVARR
jgi:hypothetical protein